eukprot:Skav200627  [mRNA]  locus=scaffold1906:78136:78620:- [translate_table: standard]
MAPSSLRLLPLTAFAAQEELFQAGHSFQHRGREVRQLVVTHGQQFELLQASESIVVQLLQLCPRQVELL